MEPVNSTQQKNKGYIKGALGAAGVCYAGRVASTVIAMTAKNAAKVDEQTKAILSTLSQDVLEKTGLAKKGVEIINVKDASIEDAFKNPIKFTSDLHDFSGDKKALDAIKEEFLNSKFIKALAKLDETNGTKEVEKALDKEAMKQIAPFKLGLNACFMPKSNKILLPENNFRTSVFHEIGHSLNTNFGTVTKQLQKLRGFSMIAPIAIIATSLLNKKIKGAERKESEMPTNPVKKAFVKTADFIKDHAGILTGLAFAPTLIEEACATLKGQKELKSLITDNQQLKNAFKQVKKTNIIALGSYALAGASFVAAAKVAINIKDKAQQNANFKAQLKQESLSELNAHQG